MAALTQAAEHYERFVSLVAANHVNQIWFNRVGTLNFSSQIDDALQDIEIAKRIDVQ